MNGGIPQFTVWHFELDVHVQAQFFGLVLWLAGRHGHFVAGRADLYLRAGGAIPRPGDARKPPVDAAIVPGARWACAQSEAPFLVLYSSRLS